MLYIEILVTLYILILAFILKSILDLSPAEIQKKSTSNCEVKSEVNTDELDNKEVVDLVSQIIAAMKK